MWLWEEDGRMMWSGSRKIERSVPSHHCELFCLELVVLLEP